MCIFRVQYPLGQRLHVQKWFTAISTSSWNTITLNLKLAYWLFSPLKRVIMHKCSLNTVTNLHKLIEWKINRNIGKFLRGEEWASQTFLLRCQSQQNSNMKSPFCNWKVAFQISGKKIIIACADPGIFVRGGARSEGQKTAWTQLTEGVQWFYCRENHTFPRIQRGSNIFLVASNYFQGEGGGGVQIKCLYL